MSRRLSSNVITGFFVGFLSRLGFDEHNRRKLINNYQKTGKIPKKKSLAVALLLTMQFGSLGLIYIAPRTGITLSILGAPLFIMTMGVLNLLFRPITILIAVLATVSYNQMRDHIFPERPNYQRQYRYNGRVYP